MWLRHTPRHRTSKLAFRGRSCEKGGFVRTPSNPPSLRAWLLQYCVQKLWRENQVNKPIGLYRQVGEGELYVRIRVSVTTLFGDQQACYTVKEEQEDSLPSKPYLDILIEGVEEHGLPSDYISTMRSLPHNRYTGEVNPP